MSTTQDPDLVDRLIDYVLRLEPALQPKRAAIETDLRAEFGGDRHYIAARVETHRQARVREILARFNGRNASEVARSLHISRATVYRVIKQPGRAIGRPDLPSETGGSHTARRRAAKDEAAALSHALPTAETPPQVG